jgi:hypothetical protein
MGYYDPLCDDADNPEDANPFHVDPKDEDEQSSPMLLSDPADINAMADATADVVGTAGLAGATTGDVTAGIESTAAATDPTDATVPSNFAIPPAVYAAIVAAIVSDLESSLAAHFTPINTRLTKMQAEILSNHGHVTKRLLPALEMKLTALAGTLDSKAMVLEAKGQSLLDKITALEGMVTHEVRKKIATLESVVEFTTKKYETLIAALESHRLGPCRSPANPPPKTTTATMPAMTLDPASASTTAPQHEGNSEGDYISPDNAAVDVNACTHPAYANFRDRNTTFHAGPPRTPYQPSDGPSRGSTPIQNPYKPSVIAPTQDRPSLHQTTLPESFGGGTHVDIHDHGSNPNSRRIGRNIVGGVIVSPHHSDRVMHARTLGASCFNIIRLATEIYHAGMDSVDALTETDIQACGHAQVMATAEDAVVCYNDIILTHCKVSELWYNGYAHTSGPQVDEILQKSLSVFPCSESPHMEDVIAFYDPLQEASLGYVIAIMPFNASVLAHRFKGLCPPGLGLVKYAAMCKALMELLLWLIPGSLSPQLNVTLASVRYESNNGYDYLWRVLELTVPGFNPTVPIHAPIWSDVEDIFHFAQAYLLFFCLQAKVKFSL